MSMIRYSSFIAVPALLFSLNFFAAKAYKEMIEMEKGASCRGQPSTRLFPERLELDDPQVQVKL